MQQKQEFVSWKMKRKLDDSRLSMLVHTYKNDTPKLLETLEFMENAKFTLADVRGVAVLLYEGLIVDDWLIDELSNNQPITSPQTIINYFSQESITQKG